MRRLSYNRTSGVSIFSAFRRFQMLDFPTIDPVQTGRRITDLRKQAGLSVHDLQHIFGFNSPQAIYKWQSGASLPSIDNLIVLAKVLRVTIEDIIVLRSPTKR
jgi:DNA-binding XRE family transcriptional regulator